MKGFNVPKTVTAESREKPLGYYEDALTNKLDVI